MFYLSQILKKKMSYNIIEANVTKKNLQYVFY